MYQINPPIDSKINYGQNSKKKKKIIKTQKRKVEKLFEALGSDQNQTNAKGDLTHERRELHIVIIMHIIYPAFSWRILSRPQSTGGLEPRKLHYYWLEAPEGGV